MDTATQVAEILGNRLVELNRESEQIEKALDALGIEGDMKTTDSSVVKSTAKKTRKRRTRKRKVNRIEQAVDLVTKTPGISGSDIAKQMKIKPNYLYRVLNSLVKDGRLKKDGRKYFPASPIEPAGNN
jgi:predicted HTH transcriptional regulator